MHKIFFVFSLALLISSGSSAAAPIPYKVDFAKAKLESVVRGSLPLELRFEIERVYTPEVIPAHAKVYGLGPTPPVGQVTFLFGWQENGKNKSVRGNASVRVYGKVAVSKTPIRHGEAISKGMVALEEKDIGPFLQTGYFTDSNLVIGRQALGTLRPGMVLGMSNTQVPKLVVSGQTVELIHKSKNLRISAKMRALEGGHRDEWIRVQNPNTKKVVSARVTGTSEVSTQ